MWYTSLIIVAFLVAVIAVFRLQPKGGRPVERTQMMHGARIILLLMAAATLIFVFGYALP